MFIFIPYRGLGDVFYSDIFRFLRLRSENSNVPQSPSKFPIKTNIFYKRTMRLKSWSRTGSQTCGVNHVGTKPQRNYPPTPGRDNGLSCVHDPRVVPKRHLAEIRHVLESQRYRALSPKP